MNGGSRLFAEVFALRAPAFPRLRQAKARSPVRDGGPRCWLRTFTAVSGRRPMRTDGLWSPRASVPTCRYVLSRTDVCQLLTVRCVTGLIAGLEHPHPPNTPTRLSPGDYVCCAHVFGNVIVNNWCGDYFKPKSSN